MFKKILNSQAGMSIIQVLIAAGMMGGLALVMGKLGENQSKMQRGAEDNADLAEFTNRMQGFLTKKDLCNKNFKNKTFSKVVDPDDETTNQLKPADGLNITSFKNSNGVELFNIYKDQVGYRHLRPSPRFNILRMTVYRIPSDQILLEFMLQKTNKRGSMGASTKFKRFRMMGTFTGNKLTSCYNDVDGAATAVCNSHGGTIINGQCMNGMDCDFETQMVNLAGGKTQHCDPEVENKLLYKEVHTAKHCTNSGGVVRTASGSLLCDFPGATCPSGWTQRSNWGSTNGAAKKCGKNRKGKSCYGGRCAEIAPRGWKEQALRSKSYGDDRARISINGCKGNGPYYVYETWKTVGCY